MMLNLKSMAGGPGGRVGGGPAQTLLAVASLYGLHEDY